jgi:hypothetical protein
VLGKNAAMTLESQIIQRTLRVPALGAAPGDGAAVARQLDAVLIKTGFKMSRGLFDHLSGHEPGAVLDKALLVLDAARTLVGDHVRHNAYFMDFPANVPDTVEFWAKCIADALESAPIPAMVARAQLVLAGGVNLLDLPTYGTYQHSYADLLAAHDELIASVKDRLTVLYLGDTLETETRRLYRELAGSTVPLSDDDRALLSELALLSVDDPQPETIPVRENRAFINAVRLANTRPLLVDTVTDVLRVACAASGGDVTLSEPTRFRSLSRRSRKVLMTALNEVVEQDPTKLGDVPRYREQWKRLGERLHPHEYQDLPRAAEVFAVARGEVAARSLMSWVEQAFRDGDHSLVVALLCHTPGVLVRHVDRVLRTAPTVVANELVVALERCAPQVSGRVLLSLREHLTNRRDPEAIRVFTNQSGRAWVTADERTPLPLGVVQRVTSVLDREITSRILIAGRLVVDPAVTDLALPLSGKSRPGGLGVMPRGSISPVDGDSLRFFIHWRQHERRTDYDLSALLLDDEYRSIGQLSWTSMRGYGGTHSGDITDAPHGASEFIDLQLSQVPATARYIVPQVHLYDGEGFTETEESLFGFMTRDREQRGRPFEPRTVRMKSELRVPGRVALPLVFIRRGDGWVAKWMHLHMNGMNWANRVEANRLSTVLLVRGVVEREVLTLGYLIELMSAKGSDVTWWTSGAVFGEGPVTFIGLDEPDSLPVGSQAYTSLNLSELVPT